jgi:mannose-1-phosphate guanylyltransferase
MVVKKKMMEKSQKVLVIPSRFDWNDLVVISNKDSVVVILKKDAQKVKEVVAYLKNKDFAKRSYLRYRNKLCD